MVGGWYQGRKVHPQRDGALVQGWSIGKGLTHPCFGGIHLNYELASRVKLDWDGGKGEASLEFGKG